MLILQLAVSAVLAFVGLIQSQYPGSFILGLVTGASLHDLLGCNNEIRNIIQSSALLGSYYANSLPSSTAPHPTSTVLQIIATPLPFDIVTPLPFDIATPLSFDIATVQTYPTQSIWDAPVISSPMMPLLAYDNLFGIRYTRFLLCIVAEVMITLLLLFFIMLLRSYHNTYSKTSTATTIPTDSRISGDDHLEYLLSSQNISFIDHCMDQHLLFESSNSAPYTLRYAIASDEITFDLEDNHDGASTFLTTFYIPSSVSLGAELSLNGQLHGLGHWHIKVLPTQDEVSSTPISTNASVMLLENAPTSSIRFEEEFVEDVSLQFPSEKLALKESLDGRVKNYLLSTSRYACLLDADFRVVEDIFDIPTECGDFLSQEVTTIETAVKMHDLLFDSTLLRPQHSPLTPHSGPDVQLPTRRRRSSSSTFTTYSGRCIELIGVCSQSLHSPETTNSASISIGKKETLLLTDVGLLFTTSPIQVFEFDGSEYNSLPRHDKGKARAEEIESGLLEDEDCNKSEAVFDDTSSVDVDTDSDNSLDVIQPSAVVTAYPIKNGGIYDRFMPRTAETRILSTTTEQRTVGRYPTAKIGTTFPIQFYPGMPPFAPFVPQTSDARRYFMPQSQILPFGHCLVQMPAGGTPPAWFNPVYSNARLSEPRLWTHVIRAPFMFSDNLRFPITNLQTGSIHQSVLVNNSYGIPSIPNFRLRPTATPFYPAGELQRRLSVPNREIRSGVYRS